MLIALEIKDNKAKVFLEFLKNLDFVTIQRSELDEEENANLIKDRLDEYKSNPENTAALKQVLFDLKLKYGL